MVMKIIDGLKFTMPTKCWLIRERVQEKVGGVRTDGIRIRFMIRKFNA